MRIAISALLLVGFATTAAAKNSACDHIFIYAAIGDPAKLIEGLIPDCSKEEGLSCDIAKEAMDENKIPGKLICQPLSSNASAKAKGNKKG